VSELTVSADGVVTGNTYDKYGSQNLVVRRLMARFQRCLDELVAQAAPDSLLDVGCGEGLLVQHMAQSLPAARVVGADLQEDSIQAGWSRHEAPNLEYRTMDGRTLPFADGEFDTVSALELLEHVPDPEAMLGEMSRCARRHLLASVPREPLWRALNVARGAYVSQLGNTPGHLNHWSRRAFVGMMRAHGEVVELRSPFPWTMLLVRL
jgi:2-polyprenyl-3-methyl-5-hydroxy-6-metoxy-1,4-benzoquinol methylase